jgi:hypothetical protein
MGGIRWKKEGVTEFLSKYLDQWDKLRDMGTDVQLIMCDLVCSLNVVVLYSLVWGTR